jgi:hypothetical protein
MQRSYAFNQNIAYWFLLLIPLVFFGFYPTYFSVLLNPTPFIVHLHFTLMALWILMLLVQPFLYGYKKLALHRTIGKVSYVLIPALLITAYFMIRFSYYRFINGLNEQVATGAVQMDHHGVLKEAATYEAIAFLYFGWLAVLYSLAVKNRRHTPTHARYMIATALTMLGPTVDRIVIWINKGLPKINGSIPIECVSFLIADCTLLFLMWNDHKNKRSIRPLGTGFMIFFGGQLIYFLVQKTEAWNTLVAFVMQAH